MKLNKTLVNYIEKNVFPEYEKNDKGHGILHIKEVIRRSFELKNSMGLELDDNLIYTIAACHDNGKYIDHKTHEKVAAEIFFADQNFKKFFSDSERQIIKEAIEDHRSSFESTPRSDYGKLISSADRNSTIEIVFVRSFFVAQERTPEMNIEDYLDYTLNRLRKRYDENDSENMFFEDEIYANFLISMRTLLKNEKEFKTRYCKVNNIFDRTKKVADYITLKPESQLE